MMAHYLIHLTGLMLRLLFTWLLLDAVLLLWGYQVGQWLRRAEDQPRPQRKDAA
ncbi:MAG TPA: hypothetical protein VI542_10025 [Candidatus Tectomicrobia bacterium]